MRPLCPQWKLLKGLILTYCHCVNKTVSISLLCKQPLFIRHIRMIMGGSDTLKCHCGAWKHTKYWHSQCPCTRCPKLFYIDPWLPKKLQSWHKPGNVSMNRSKGQTISVWIEEFALLLMGTDVLSSTIQGNRCRINLPATPENVPQNIKKCVHTLLCILAVMCCWVCNGWHIHYVGGHLPT